MDDYFIANSIGLEEGLLTIDWVDGTKTELSKFTNCTWCSTEGTKVELHYEEIEITIKVRVPNKRR